MFRYKFMVDMIMNNKRNQMSLKTQDKASITEYIEIEIYKPSDE